jgi:hypothetical protein
MIFAATRPPAPDRNQPPTRGRVGDMRGPVPAGARANAYAAVSHSDPTRIAVSQLQNTTSVGERRAA